MALPPHNPNFVPSGTNNKANPYYKRINHVRLARSDYNKSEFFGTVGGVVPDVPDTVYGPFVGPSSTTFWLRGTKVDPELGVNLDNDDEPDVWVDIKTKPDGISQEAWDFVRAKIAEVLP